MEKKGFNKNNKELIDALKQIQNEEWSDKKEKINSTKSDNLTGCLWAAIITIVILVIFFVWLIDELSWIT